MRKFIIAVSLVAVALLVVSTPSRAESYCDWKGSQAERIQCYQMAINGGLARMKENYNRINNHNGIPDHEREQLTATHEKWANDTDTQCRDDSCVYDRLSKRNRYIEQFMRERGLKPI